MEQQQHQDEYRSSDPFMEYVDSLPEPHIDVSDQVDKDVSDYEVRKKENRSQRRFRITTFIITAVAALGVNLILRAGPAPAPAEKPAQNPIWHETHPVRRIKYGPGDGVLDKDLKDPEILIDGDYYHFPFRISELLERGWEIDPFYQDMKADQYTNYITLRKGDEVLSGVAVISPDGRPVSMDQALVTGFDVYDPDEVEVILPGFISADITNEDELIRAMRDSGLSWAYDEYEKDGKVVLKNYTYYAESENDSFKYYVVTFSVNKEGKVISIEMSLVNYRHPFGIENAVNQ